MPEIQLNRKERLILANQFRILEKLDPENAEEYKRCLDILCHGFELEYDELAGFVVFPDSEKVSEEACREVIDILAMYRHLQSEYQNLADKSGIHERDLCFFGFDGNYESAQLAYHRYLHAGAKFEESPPQNSHGHSLDIYRRMLAEYRQVKHKPSLDKADIQRVLAARVHPSVRDQAQT